MDLIGREYASKQKCEFSVAKNYFMSYGNSYGAMLKKGPYTKSITKG